MEHNMVIAQVGKGGYGETHYQKRDVDGLGEIIDTCYSFEAVIRECFKGQSLDVLHLLLVGTHTSGWNALLNYYSLDKTDVTDPDEECSEEEFENRLADLLQQRFEIVNQSKAEADEKIQIKKILIKRVIIEQGQSGEELRSNFADLQNAVDDVRKTADKEADWDIYFDISNGFRSFPIYIYTLINYLSQTESGKTRCHMFYGMFDSKITVKEETEKGEIEKKKEITPLVDLQFIDDLLLLTNAVSEFQNCGSVKQILGILETRPDWDIQIGNNDKETLSYAFKMFDYGTNADNLDAIIIGVDFLKNMRSKIEDAESLKAAEKELLLGIADDFSDRFSYKDKHNQYSYLMIKLAEWFHSNGREGNAAIVVQETVLTYLLERYTKQFKEYFLELKALNQKDIKDALDEDSDLKAEGNLFNNVLRTKVKELLNDLGKGDDDTVQENVNNEIEGKSLNNLNKEVDDTFKRINEFYKNYKYIQENVRNVMAHILPSDTAYKDYTKIVKKQIEYLKGEIIKAERIADGKDIPNDSDIIIEILFSGKVYNEVKLSLKAKELRERRWQPFNVMEAEENRFYSNYNKLLQEIDRMQQITDEHVSDADEGYKYFYDEKNNLRLLFECLDKLICCSQKNNPDWDEDESALYPNYYKKSKSVPSKRGYARLKDILKGKWKVIIPVLESYQE